MSRVANGRSTRVGPGRQVESDHCERRASVTTPVPGTSARSTLGSSAAEIRASFATTLRLSPWDRRASRISVPILRRTSKPRSLPRSAARWLVAIDIDRGAPPLPLRYRRLNPGFAPEVTNRRDRPPIQPQLAQPCAWCNRSAGFCTWCKQAPVGRHSARSSWSLVSSHAKSGRQAQNPAPTVPIAYSR